MADVNQDMTGATEVSGMQQSSCATNWACTTYCNVYSISPILRLDKKNWRLTTRGSIGHEHINAPFVEPSKGPNELPLTASASTHLLTVCEVLQQKREQLLFFLCQMLEKGGLDLLHLADQLPDNTTPLLALGAHGCIDELRQLLEQTFLK